MSLFFRPISRKLVLECIKRLGVMVLVFCIVATSFIVQVFAGTEDDYIPPKTLTGFDVVTADVNDMVVYPHFGTPVFAEPGTSFEIEFSLSEELPVTGWTAWVENDLKRWFCQISDVEMGENNIYLGMKSGYTARITLPADVSPELCTLVISHESGKTLRSVASVSVVPELDTDFYIINTTDTHLVAYDENRQDGALQGKTLGMMAQVATLAGARFFSHTGDVSLSHNESREVSIRDFFVDPVVRMGRVPLVFANGNHEYDYWVTPAPSLDWGLRAGEFDQEDCDRYFGMRSQIITMGSFLVAKHDFGGYWDFPELRAALTAKWNNQPEDITYRLVLQHTHNGGTALFHNQTPEEIHPYPNLMIKGHDHQWRSIAPSTAYPFQIISCGGGARRVNGTELPPVVEPWWVWGDSAIFDFRIDQNKNWTCPSAENWTPSKGRFQLIEDARTGMEKNKLRDSYVNDNTTGTATENLCTITNKLNFNFYDGRVRFLMAKGTYRVNGGEIISQYDYRDETGEHTAVLVRVNIPEMDTTHVQIYQEGSEPTIPIPDPPEEEPEPPVDPDPPVEVKTAWEFTEDLEGWYGQDNNHIDELVWQEGGYIGANLLGSDPIINSPDNLNIDLSQYKIIKIGMKNISSSVRAKIYFSTQTSPSFSESRAVVFTLNPNDDEYTEYVIDMSVNPEWNGKLKQIRFDPIDDKGVTKTGAFSIDYFRIEKIPTPPVASNVEITGTAILGNTLAGSYTYSQEEGLPEEGTSFRWLRSDSAGGVFEAIPGATSITYTLTPDDVGKYIKFEVKPGAGTIKGDAKTSSPVGPVAMHQMPSVELIGNSNVGRPGQIYNLTVTAISVPEMVYTADITVDFDINMLQYEAVFSATEEIQIIETDISSPGRLRVILAAPGCMESNTDLVDIQFRVKDLQQAASGIISVSRATFGTAPEGDIIEAALSQIEISFTTMDINRNGKVDVGDLAIAVYHYQKTPQSSDWSVARAADINGDNVVNMADIALIANAIIAED